MSWLGRSTLQDEIDPHSAPLAAIDIERLGAVQASLARGLAIKSWWDQQSRDWRAGLDVETLPALLGAKRFGESFTLMQPSQHWPHDVSCGFFDRIEQDGLNLPVMGCFQQFFYDQPTLRFRDALRRVQTSAATIDRAAEEALNNWRNNLREFVLGTFINATSGSRPYPVADGRNPLASYLEPFSWCPEGKGSRTGGMRYSQVYYQRLDNGRVGKFWPVDYSRINLRDIGTKYAWIVIEDEASSFDLSFSINDQLPYIGLPIVERQFGVISPELVLADETTEEDILARFGFGYALLEQPGSSPDGISTPYDTGLQQTEFWLHEDGQILVQNFLVTERPTRVSPSQLNPFELGISAIAGMTLGLFANVLRPLKERVVRIPLIDQFDPLITYARLANAISAGFAAKELCIGIEELERRILFKHHLKQFETVLATRGVWRHRRDWTKPVTGHGH